MHIVLLLFLKSFVHTLPLLSLLPFCISLPFAFPCLLLSLFPLATPALCCHFPLPHQYKGSCPNGAEPRCRNWLRFEAGPACLLLGMVGTMDLSPHHHRHHHLDIMYLLLVKLK